MKAKRNADKRRIPPEQRREIVRTPLHYRGIREMSEYQYWQWVKGRFDPFAMEDRK